jgi:UDP-N-acetylmuramoylalanine--D-glutamate ligase
MSPRPAHWTPGSRYRGQPVLVVGLGLSGVSTLHYLAAEGAELTVTDSRSAPAGIAELQAQYPELRFCLGGFSAADPLPSYALAVVSPGVDLQEPFVQALRAAAVPLVGDVELFARALAEPNRSVSRVVGITGSNGKSTVTTLLGEMAKAAGAAVAVGGNLGTPALDLLDDRVALYILELSSFQLETTETLQCAAATVLNLSEDHLDRHRTMAAYAAAKARIFRHCERAVLNRDDAAVMALPRPAAQPAVSFGLTPPSQPGDWGCRAGAADSEVLVVAETGETALLDAAELQIAGRHNLANALAALALAAAVGLPRAACLAALRRFCGLPHRCRLVRDLAGVRYYNDSKGTNVGSTLAAIQGLPPPIHWLGGGQGKGQDFAPLADALRAADGRAYLYGQDARLIAQALQAAVPCSEHADLFAALAAAQAVAKAPATVLLSPACASLDQFRNYIDRGEQFERAVEALA